MHRLFVCGGGGLFCHQRATNVCGDVWQRMQWHLVGNKGRLMEKERHALGSDAQEAQPTLGKGRLSAESIKEEHWGIQRYLCGIIL